MQRNSWVHSITSRAGKTQWDTIWYYLSHCRSEILSCCDTPPASRYLEHSWTRLLWAISHVSELGIQVNDLHSFKTLPCECSDGLYFDTFSPCNLARGTFHLPFNCHGRTAVDFSLKNMISMEINPKRHFSLQPCLITTATLHLRSL